MTYGYIRVSTELQTVENQRFEINEFCAKKGMQIDEWVGETVSGTITYKDRDLGKLLKRVKEGDVIVCSELSRLGRNLYMIMEILNLLIEKKCEIYTIKDQFVLGKDISSKVTAFAFGLSAEIERNLISQRTKEALARLRAEGVVLGRPKGHRTCDEKHKLYKKKKEIAILLHEGLAKRKIARLLKVHRNTLDRYIQNQPEITEYMNELNEEAK